MLKDVTYMIHKTSTIIILLAAILFIGCGKGLDKGTLSPLSMMKISPTPDGTAPYVTAWAPEGPTVSVSAKITARFSEAIDVATVTASTFQVTAGGVAVTGTISYNSLTKTVTFTPVPALVNLTDYTVTISGTITDKAGIPMGTDKTWSFTTYDLLNTLPRPGFSPLSDTYDSGSVSLTYTGPLPVTIHYTIDGTDPSPTTGTLWDGTPIPVSTNTVIKAIAFGNPGYYDSPVATGNFYVHSDQPTFTYTGGTYHGDFDLEIFPPSSDPAAIIYYEMTVGTVSSMPADPPDPTTLSGVYTAPIPIAGDQTVVKIKAIAVSSGKCPSTVITATYIIDYYQVGTPTFSVDPATGPFDTPQSVTINHDAGSSVYYTTNGDDPLLFGSLYDDTPISVSDTMTINAYAIASGWIDSAVVTGNFLINPAIASINANAASNSETNLFVSINGERFKAGATVALTDGVSTINGTSVNVVDASKITCYVNLSGASTGYWNVNVTNTDTGTATLLTGFRIYADPTGIASWWKLNGDETDSMGVNDGTITGSITYTSDRFGTASGAAVNSTMVSYISATATGLPTGSASRTMMGWFRADSLGAIDSFLFGYGSGTNSCKLYISNIGNRLTFSDNGMDIIAGMTYLQSGRWYHAAVTYDQSIGTVTLYLDGAVEGTTYTTLSTPVSGQMYMFKAGSPTPYLAGALDDVMVLNTAMTQAEVKAVAANSGYLLPPTGLQTWGGASYVYLSWDASLNATEYDVFRSSGLFSTYTQINTGTVTDTNYTDNSVTPGVIYYYKVRAKNAAMTSDLTKAEAGFIGTYTTLTEGFEWLFQAWWDTPVYTGSTTVVFTSTDPSQAYGNSCMKLTSATSCTGGCGFTESLALTVTFGTPISLFNLSMYYIFTPGVDAGGNFSVYINNTDPASDPVTGLVPFKETLRTGGWWQRTLYYLGDHDVNTITLVFYDLTDTVEFDADQLKINYK